MLLLHNDAKPVVSEAVLWPRNLVNRGVCDMDMLNAEKSSKFGPSNFSIRNDNCNAEMLALPALASSSFFTALKRTGRQIRASRVLLLLLLLLPLLLLLLLLLLLAAPPYQLCSLKCQA